MRTSGEEILTLRIFASMMSRLLQIDSVRAANQHLNHN